MLGKQNLKNFEVGVFFWENAGSTISTLLHDRINPKDCQVLSLGDTGFLQFFRVVSRDYGKPRNGEAVSSSMSSIHFFGTYFSFTLELG